jgi:hypothetical protein
MCGPAYGQPQLPIFAEVRWLSLQPDAVASALYNLWSCVVSSGASSMYWRVKSSTDGSVYDTPPVAVYATGCEALCARLSG